MAQRREECVSGRDFILVKTHFPMGVNVLGGIYIKLIELQVCICSI